MYFFFAYDVECRESGTTTTTALRIQKMFRAKMKETRILKKIVEAIKDMVTDANIECSPKGMVMQAMDSAHVSMTQLILPAHGFEEYLCEKSLNVGVNFDMMWKVIKGERNDTSVVMRTKEGADTLNFEFCNDTGTRKSTKKLNLLDIEADLLGIPEERDTAFQITMDAREYQEICRDLTDLSNVVYIEAADGAIFFRGTGDIGSGHKMLKQDENTDIEIHESISRQFSHRYLCLVGKGAPLAAKITIEVGNDTPLVATYEIEGDCKKKRKKNLDGSGRQDEEEEEGENIIGSLRFYVAPQIEQEDT